MDQFYVTLDGKEVPEWAEYKSDKVKIKIYDKNNNLYIMDGRKTGTRT